MLLNLIAQNRTEVILNLLMNHNMWHVHTLEHGSWLYAVKKTAWSTQNFEVIVLTGFIKHGWDILHKSSFVAGNMVKSSN